MKLFFLLFAWMLSLQAYTQNSPCDPRTTNWEPVLNHSLGTVWIKITYTRCTKDGGICGWPLIQLQHSFPYSSRLDVRLEGIDCEDKLHQASFSTGGDAIAPRTDYKSSGNWHLFKRVDRAIRVEVDYDIGDDHFTIKKENGVIRVYKNNQLIRTNGLTEREEKEIQEKKAEEDRVRKEAEEKQRQAEESARAEKKKASEKLKKENDKLETSIQSDISKIPAEGPRSQLQKEFDEIRNEDMTEEERDEELRSFHFTVKSKLGEVQRNLNESKAKTELREEQIDAIRDENDEIRHEQKEIIGGMAALGAGMLSFGGRKGQGKQFRGASYKFSIKGGLHGLMQPLGYTSYTTGTMYNYYSGNITTVDEKSFSEKALVAPGLYLTAEFHPYFSNFMSLGVTGSISYCYWPEANDGTSDATLNYAGNSRTTVLHYNYGAEFTLGARPVKLLARYHIQTQDIISSSISATIYDDGYNSMETETFYFESQKWKSHWAALGLRIGDYKKNRWFLDLAFTRYIPVNINGVPITFKPKDLVTSGGSKVPFGGYLQYSQQNGWFVRAVFTKDNIIISEEEMKLYRAEKPFVTLTIGKSLEWFGKPYASRGSQ